MRAVYMVRLWAAGLIIAAAAMAAEAPPSSVTFNKSVLPILQDKCQNCHRPGQVAPMSLLTYQDARPWAKAIKAAVQTRKMPPWNADPGYSHFLNDRSLSQGQIDTLVAWADNGALEGNAKDAPPPKQWPAGGWEVQPDIIVACPEFDVPASGVIDLFWVPISGAMFTTYDWSPSIRFLPF